MTTTYQLSQVTLSAPQTAATESALVVQPSLPALASPTDLMVVGTRSRLAGPLPQLGISMAGLATIAGMLSFGMTGPALIATTETSSRYGGAPLPPMMVLTALTSNGVLYFGPSRSGDRNETVWSRDAVQVESIAALCQLLNVKVELDAQSPTPA